MPKGEILAAIYSWGCRKSQEFECCKTLRQFVESDGQKSRKKALTCLKNLSPYKYYQTIANICGIKNAFDLSIVEFYWTGYVGQLRNIDRENCLKFTHNFTVFKYYDPEIVSHLPVDLQKSIEDCRIAWGQIKKIKGNKVGKRKIIVSYQPLIFAKGIRLGKNENKEVVWHTQLMPKLKIDDMVCMHLGTIRQILSKKEVAALKKNTISVLDVVNAQTKHV